MGTSIYSGHPWTIEWLFNLSTVSRSNSSLEEFSGEVKTGGTQRKNFQSKDKHHQQTQPKINMMLSPEIPNLSDLQLD